MRVIAGLYKRRILQTLPGTDITRPTSDRVKESIFNILACAIEGTTVLDLFAGSGSLGIEALSRGAHHAVFIEKNRESCKVIQNNLDHLKIPKENYTLIQCDVSQFLKMQSRRFKQGIDIIFADPPYASDWYETALEEIETAEICKKHATLILESSEHTKISPDKPIRPIKNLHKTDERLYGKTRIEIWRNG